MSISIMHVQTRTHTQDAPNTNARTVSAHTSVQQGGGADKDDGGQHASTRVFIRHDFVRKGTTDVDDEISRDLMVCLYYVCVCECVCVCA